MNSDWHGLPIINGLVQLSGAEHAARDVRSTGDGNSIMVSAELAVAWPEQLGLESYVREPARALGAGCGGCSSRPKVR